MYSSGVARLDAALRGGVQSGLLEIFGPAASGKTALAASFVREVSLSGEPCGWVQAAGFPEVRWLSKCGAGDCLVARPTTGEGVFETAHSMLAHGAKCVVVDGLSQLEPSSEAQLHLGDSILNNRNRFLFHGCYHLARTAVSQGALVILVNETRAQPGRGEVSAMRNILRRSNATRLRTKRLVMRTAYGEFGYLQVGFKVIRAGAQPPGAEAAGLVTPNGFDRNLELLIGLQDTGVLERRGSYWTNETYGQFGPGYTEGAKQVAPMYETLKGVHDESRSNRRDRRAGASEHRGKRRRW